MKSQTPNNLATDLRDANRRMSIHGLDFGKPEDREAFIQIHDSEALRRIKRDHRLMQVCVGCAVVSLVIVLFLLAGGGSFTWALPKVVR